MPPFALIDSRAISETRVLATEPVSRRRFRRYCVVVGAGIKLICVLALRLLLNDLRAGRRYDVLACLFLAAALSGPVTPLPSVPLPPELSRVLTDYETAWGRRDAAALARLFADDGFVLSGGKPPIRGRAAIEAAYAGHGGPLFLRALAFAVEGGVGYIIGGYAHARGAPDDGKFTLTLKKGPGGRWLIMSDMDNGNQPPPRKP